MKPIAIYARYSSHNQDRGTSIDVQLEVCRRSVADRTNLQPLTYVDRAVTGTTMSRPQFNRMLADAEAGLFDVLVVYKFDRFGRSAYAHAIHYACDAAGVPRWSPNRLRHNAEQRIERWLIDEQNVRPELARDAARGPSGKAG